MSNFINIKGYINKYNTMSAASRATICFMICSFVQKGFSLCTTPIFSRLMTKDQYGVYSVYLSWLEIMTIIVTLRLDFSIFNKGMATYPEKRDEYASSMLGITTILNTILFVLCLIFMPFIKQVTEFNTIIILGMLAELYFIPAISFWTLRERYEFRYRSVVAVTLLSAFLNAIIGVLAVLYFEDKGTARVLSCVFVQILAGSFVYFQLVRRGKKLFSFEYFKFAISFNLVLVPYYLSSYIIEQSDRIMIQKMKGYEAAAMYNLAYTVGNIIKIVSNTLSNSLIPLIYRQLEKEDYDATKKLMGRVMRILLLAIPFFVCVAPEVVLLMGGRTYYDARYVIPPVSMSVFFSLLYAMAANIEFYYDRAKYTTITAVIAALLNLCLNWLLIPIFGYIIAAYTTLFSYIFLTVCHLLYIRKIMLNTGKKEVIDLKEMALYSFLTIVIALFISGLYPFPIIRYGVVLLGSLVILKNKIKFV